MSILRRVHGDGGPQRRLNVILVMIESLSAEYLARFTPSSTLTPNLDELIGESLFFNRLYATGTRTVRGLEAVTLSFPTDAGTIHRQADRSRKRFVVDRPGAAAARLRHAIHLRRTRLFRQYGGVLCRQRLRRDRSVERA